jgi:hypothetical protein
VRLLFFPFAPIADSTATVCFGRAETDEPPRFHHNEKAPFEGAFSLCRGASNPVVLPKAKQGKNDGLATQVAAFSRQVILFYSPQANYTSPPLRESLFSVSPRVLSTLIKAASAPLFFLLHKFHPWVACCGKLCYNGGSSPAGRIL